MPPKCTDEFKQKAAKHVVNNNYSIQKVAERLSRSGFYADKEVKMWIYGIINVTLMVVSFFGIYNFNHNILFAVIGTLVISGISQGSPILALIAYPLVEYFLGHGLTIYSAIFVGITIIQLALVFLQVTRK